MAVRPTILVAEPEALQSLSVRKLVLETAKFNVLTAHSTREAAELFAIFPNVSGVVLVSGDKAIDCNTIADLVKRSYPATPVIVLLQGNGFYKTADVNLPACNPDELLDKMRELFGDPRRLEEQNEQRQ